MNTTELKNATAPDFADPRAAINGYIARIDDLTEVDYGDFKRKVGQYLLRIEELLAARGRRAPLAILEEIRQKIVYYPQFDIEDGREYTIAQLQKMLEIL